MEPIERDLDSFDWPLRSEPMLLDVGPSQPTMHGSVRVAVELFGETIERCDVQVGYLHRGVEKTCERALFTQVFPYVERCNWASSMLNSVGFALACEKMLKLEVPERGQFYRMILGELSRIADHLGCLSAVAYELSAAAAAQWMVKARDWVWGLFESETGARIMPCFCRIGGMARPPTETLSERVLAVLTAIESVLDDVDRVLVENRVFLERMENVGRISADDAVSLGFTGPALRATGIAYDVRRCHPYLRYGDIEFDVPVGSHGDCLDRFLVRFDEIRQSMRIIRQCLKVLPRVGQVSVDVPLRPEVDSGEERLHNGPSLGREWAKMEGIRLPKGEAYSATEAGNGELGFYLVSDGTETPYRLRIRPPSFYIASGVERIITKLALSDLAPCFSSLNIIGGECDR